MPSFDMSIPPATYVDTEEAARKWLAHYLTTHDANNGLGLDTETTGKDRRRDKVLFWSLSDGKSRICLSEKFLPVFKPLLENPQINFDLTNAKFDAHMLANSGIDISKAGQWRDTIVQSWLFNENNRGRHGLKECITDHFGRVTPTFEQVFGKVPPLRRNKETGAILSKTPGDLILAAFEDPRITADRAVSEARSRSKKKDITKEELDAVWKTAYAEQEARLLAAYDYSGLDSYNSTTLRAFFDAKLAEEEIFQGWTLRDHFYRFECDFTKVLWRMERFGITADKGYFVTQAGPMRQEMDNIVKEFAHETTRLTGQPTMFNLNSYPAVRHFFYELLQKKKEVFTDGGTTGIKQPSTEAEVVEGWAGQGCEWARKLLRYRSIAKIYGTYVIGLQDHIDYNFRIHTTLNQTGAATGRLSSSEPNLQNIPRPDEDEYRCRDGFIPGDRKALVVADYGQIEMRLMAHFSQDKKMIDAINKGIDIHCLTVSEMNGIPYEEVVAAKKADGKHKEGKGPEPTERQKELVFLRQCAKAIGFGIIYGIGGKTLAENLTRDTGRYVSEDEGWSKIEQWFGVFPGVRLYIEQEKLNLWKHGRVQTLLGRYRRFGTLSTMSKRDKAEAERQAVNAKIQGTAADIAKLAMILVDTDAELKSYGYRLMLQVHDELVGECDDIPEVTEKAKARVQYLMENALGYELSVKLPAEVHSGYSWSEAK